MAMDFMSEQEHFPPEKSPVRVKVPRLLTVYWNKEQGTCVFILNDISGSGSSLANIPHMRWPVIWIY